MYPLGLGNELDGYIINADVAKLADAQVSGSCGRPCRFKSCHPHHERVIILIQKVSRLLPFLLLLGVFLPYFRLLTVVLTVESRFLVAPTFFTHPQIVKIMR